MHSTYSIPTAHRQYSCTHSILMHVQYLYMQYTHSILTVLMHAQYLQYTHSTYSTHAQYLDRSTHSTYIATIPSIYSDWSTYSTHIVPTLPMIPTVYLYDTVHSIATSVYMVATVPSAYSVSILYKYCKTVVTYHEYVGTACGYYIMV